MDTDAWERDQKRKAETLKHLKEIRNWKAESGNGDGRFSEETKGTKAVSKTETVEWTTRRAQRGEERREEPKQIIVVDGELDSVRCVLAKDRECQRGITAC